MLECYFDDSSDENRKNVYVCGGGLGSPDQWDFVDAMWSHHTFGLTAPFRSADCETGHGQFIDWPKPSRDALMAALVNVLDRGQIYGFGSVVPVETFKKIFPNSTVHEPFKLAVTHAMMNMALIADNLSSDAEIWFEHGPGNGCVKQVFESLSVMDWGPVKRLKRLRLETKKLRLLQCADLIAREAFKHRVNLGARPTRKPVLRLRDRLFFSHWNESALSFISQNGGLSNLECLKNWDLNNSPRFKIFWKNF